MKKTYEQLLDFQQVGLYRLQREKEAKKETKLGACLKKMLGDPGARLKGTISDIGIDYQEKQEDIRRKYCSVDKDDNILRGDLTQKNTVGDTTISKTGPYLFTRDNDKKCANELKNLLKESVHIDAVLCQDLPADLTEAEEICLVGFVFTDETLAAWQEKQSEIEHQKNPETNPETSQNKKPGESEQK